MVATLLLGFAVGLVGLLALLMWSDARDARDAAAGPSAAVSEAGSSTAGHALADHNVALPIESFAGVVPDNAAELAEAHAATTPHCLPPRRATWSRSTWSSRT